MVKSAIQIFCRIKPSKSSNLIAYNVNDEPNRDQKSTLEFFVPRDNTDGYVNNKKENHVFGFNKVFNQKASQDLVFDDVAKGVIDNVLAGYNGTIFAYGQTGSGKTFTITGGVEKYADRGIIPRALSYIFKQYEQEKDKIHTTEISYLEIYNECGYDLLDPRHEATKLEDLPKVSLMEDTDQNVHLRNMSVLPAQNVEEALNLLFLGDTNRMVAETPMNQASTRSHCIFTVHVTSREPGSATIKTSKLHLVDLAGSERVGKTKVGGQLLTEAKYINLSLHYLEQVIVALGEKKRQHIPYRNSMMTSVLRDSLGGNCMTTMIATVSVQTSNVHESISTCKFAQRVAMIKNEAMLNEQLDPKLMIAKLKKEVERLRAELTLASGEERSDEELSEDEIERLNALLDAYIESHDPEQTLEVGGDMRKIQHCYRRFKHIVLTANQQHRQQSPNGSLNQQQQDDQQSYTDDRMERLLDGKQTQRLKEILEQRDSEISILVDMLKRERMKQQNQSLTGDELASASNSSLSLSTSGANTATDSTFESNRLVQHRQNEMASSSAAKSEAFENFKRRGENQTVVEDQKKTLRTRYGEAKKLGQEVNDTRKKINELKKLAEEVRVKKEGVGEDDASRREMEEQEEVIRKQIDEWKVRYQGKFGRLKSMKTEIEHLHHILNKTRLNIQNSFEQWWQQQQSRPQQAAPKTETSPTRSAHQPRTVDSRGDEGTKERRRHESFESSSQSPAAVPHRLSLSRGRATTEAVSRQNSGRHRDHQPAAAANIPLTGDSETDANILAFVQARQNYMNNS